MSIPAKDRNNTAHLGKSIRFVTIVGLCFNLVLAGMKFYAGFFGGSQALVADAVHSLSDTVSDIAIIVGSYYWYKPADKEHPYGHRRIETIVTILVGVLLIMAGVGIINEAIDSLRSDLNRTPKLIAVVAAFVSIVIKEILYRWTMKFAKKIKSTALVANAWHHRTDAFSSIPALIATGGILIVPSWIYLDQLGALIISVFIFHTAYQIIYKGIKELIDSSASSDTCDKIISLTRQVNGVLQVHGLRTRLAGSIVYVDLHVLVDGTISVKQGHDVAKEVKRSLLGAGLDIIDIIVHIEPTEN